MQTLHRSGDMRRHLGGHSHWMSVSIVLGALALNTWSSRVLQAQARTDLPNTPEETAERLVIVDDDTAMLQAMVAREGVYRLPWLRITDPDGGLEILYLLREPTVKLLGISCIMGCSTTGDGATKVTIFIARTSDGGEAYADNLGLPRNPK